MVHFKFFFLSIVSFIVLASFLEASQSKKLVYVVSDIRIPFWKIMSRGMQSEAKKLDYELEIYSANNIKKQELELVVKALKSDVAGLVISPISSSTSVTILKFAKKADTPVVIADIGTQSGDYISYISSNNTEGAYEVGKILVKKMKALYNENAAVGIIAIPQKRANGKARTLGFMKAMQEAEIKSADLKQQVNFSCEETYKYAREMIQKNPNLHAIWLQGSNRYKAALNAIKDENKKGEILLVTFDAEPEFLELIANDIVLGAAMQQPYLMGEEAIKVMDDYLKGKNIKKNIELPILAISKENIDAELSTIKRNVLGMKGE